MFPKAFRTSNPAFNDYFWNQNYSETRTMSVSGIVVKSIGCLILISLITAAIWKLDLQGKDLTWYRYGGLIAAIILSVIISYNKHLASILVPLYAIAKGCFLGAFTAWIKSNYPEIPYQAIGITIVTFLVVLILYQLRLIVVTKTIRSIIITAATSIFLVYIISFILEFFGMRSFLWGTSILAIMFNSVAALVASLTFLLDFDYIERQKNKAPKQMEWFATWGLLVSILWLYIELVRLMRKLAIRF